MYSTECRWPTPSARRWRRRSKRHARQRQEARPRRGDRRREPGEPGVREGQGEGVRRGRHALGDGPAARADAPRPSCSRWSTGSTPIPTIHGFLVQLPLPKHINSERVLNAIDPAKDVDGFHPVNVGKLSIGDPTALKPATPFGVQQMLIRSGIETRGANAVIVGPLEHRGQADGEPADPAGHGRRRDGHRLPLQVARPAGRLPLGRHPGRGDRASPSSSPPTWCGPAPRSSTSASTAWTTPSQPKGYRHRRRRGLRSGGARWRGAITPVPGGVGRMTIAMLLQNTLQAFEQAADGEAGSRPRTATACLRRPSARLCRDRRISHDMALSRSDLISPTDDVWSVTQLTTAAKRVVEGAVRRRSGSGARSSAARRGRAGTGTSICATPTARCAAACGSATPCARGKPPADGTEVFVLGTARHLRGQGRVPAQRHRACCPTAAIGQAQRELERVKALLQKDGLFDPARKRPLPALRRARSRWSPARPARRCATSSPSPARRWPVRARPGGRRAGAGRRRGGGAGARARGWSTGCRAWSLHRRAAAAAAGRTSPPSTPRRSAARSPPCGCRPSPRWATRPTSRSPISSPTCAPPRRRPRRSWRWPTRATCAGRSTTSAPRLGRRPRRPHPARRSSGSSAPATGCRPRIAAVLERRRHHVARLAAQLDALSPLRVLERGYAVPTGADGRVLKRRADFAAGDAVHACGWPTAASTPAWSPA